MQYELRTQVVEPRRATFTHLAERYGERPASRYEEGSVDVQAVDNFHYRPLWAPGHELYDVTWSKLRLTDPYAFVDPRQYYYAPYVMARAELHDAFARTLEYLDGHDLVTGLPEGWRAALERAVIPMRHYESGAQMISTYGARFAYGTTIEQCCSFAAFDRIGNAQMLSRLGMALDGGSDRILSVAKQAWTDDQALQPLRRLTEELLVEPDWGAALVGLDLTDRLLYRLLYHQLDAAALRSGALGYSLAAAHLAGWFANQRRWIDALIAAWVADPAHGWANAAVLEGIADRIFPQATAAVRAVGAAVDSYVAADAAAAAERGAEVVRSGFDLALAGPAKVPAQTRPGPAPTTKPKES